MKAYHLNGDAGAGGLVLADVSRPEPAGGEVRIRVEAASLNYRDLMILDRVGQGGLNGRVPLSDGAGVVDAIGSGVTQWQPGDRVVASFFRDWVAGPFKSSYVPSAPGGNTMDGMLAEYVVLPATALVSAPAHLSAVEAATLPCAGVTAGTASSLAAGWAKATRCWSGNRRRRALRPSVRRGAGRARDRDILLG